MNEARPDWIGRDDEDNRYRARQLVERRRLRLEALSGRLHALSPLATLGRGFAVVHDAAGSPITTVSAVTAGDPIHVRLRDGLIEGRAERITRESSSREAAP